MSSPTSFTLPELGRTRLLEGSHGGEYLRPPGSIDGPERAAVGELIETGRDFVTRSRRAWLDPDALAAELRRSGIDHICIETDKPFDARVRHFCKARNLLGRGAR